MSAGNLNVNITGTISNLQDALNRAKDMIESFSPIQPDPLNKIS